MLIRPGQFLTPPRKKTPLENIKASLGGISPLYYGDFINDQAISNGGAITSIASIPNLTGTLNIVAGAGHRVASAANILQIGSVSIPYPFTLWAEFTRTTDTGGVEVLVQASFGADNLNTARLNVEAADRASGTLVTAGITEANEIRSGVLAVGTKYKIATRYALNNVKTARGGLLSTGDTACTPPSTPTTISIGGNISNLLFLTGDIARFAIFNTALADANLQVLTT